MSQYRDMGPQYIYKEIVEGNVGGLDGERKKIAYERWKIAIDSAKNAERQIPICNSLYLEETALLVVDMQKAFLDKGSAIEVPDGRNIVKNINLIIKKFRYNNGLLIFLRYLVDERVGLLKYFEEQSYLGEGRESPQIALRKGHPQFEIYEEIDVKQEDIIVDKIRYSAVHGSNIVEILRDKRIRNVVVTGVTTDVCAGNTAECLMQKDYHVVMVWDATAALDRLEHELYLARIFGLYGDVMPTEEVISRLLCRALA